MTKYMSREGFSGLRRWLFVILGLLTFAACTSVDDSLGGDFIPGNQYFSIKIDSSFVIKTYNTTKDSTRSEGYSSNYLGGFHFEQAGTVDASVVFHMAPPFFGDSEDNKFNSETVIDSLTLVFGVNSFMGKSDVVQTFELYKLREDIYVDSAYYTDFDPTTVIEDDPYLTFDYTYDKNYKYITYKIDDEDLMVELADTTGFWNNEEFHKRFKGFYIKPKIAHNDAAVYNISLNNSYIVAYYRNEDGEDAETKTTLFLFSKNASYFEGDNQSINVVDYDFTGADPALRIDDTSVPAERTFVQGYGGLNTSLEFTEESINAIKARIPSSGFRKIAINKARLEITFVDRDPDNMKNYFSRMGMYTDYNTFTPIADYDYTTESTYGYTIAYGGYINRSRYIYEMDITRYVQSFFSDSYEPSMISLSPSVEEASTLKYAGLNGYGSNNPMRLIITYSLIK